MGTEQRQFLVAGVDSAELSWDFQQSCLREAELQEAEAIPNRRRRDEWVAGRIAAKYAFLCGEASLESAESGALHFRILGSADLAAFASAAYRSVAVVRDRTPGGGPARVGWSCSGESLPAAISHSAGLSCASVGAMGAFSLDLEIPAPRVPEFYLRTFTSRERDWVSSCSVFYGFHSDWLYTLLWSARECLLKTPRYAALSLWDMPVLEIDIRDGTDRLVEIYEASNHSGNFVVLQASTFDGPFQLAVAGGPKLVLTAVTRSTSNRFVDRGITTNTGHASDMDKNFVAAPLPVSPATAYGGRL